MPVVRAGVTTQVNTGTLVADMGTAKTDITSLKASRTTDEANIATLQTQVAGLGPRTPLDQSTWTWLNQGTVTVSQSGGVVRLVNPTSDVTENIRGRFTAAPTAPYTITALVIPGFMTQSGLCGTGIGFRESGTSKVTYIAIVGNAGGAGPKFHLRENTNETTNSTSVTTATFVMPPAPGVWFRLTDNGTNISYAYSWDGVNFVVMLNELRTAFFTVKPNQVGIFIQNFGSLQSTDGSIVSWVQS